MGGGENKGKTAYDLSGSSYGGQFFMKFSEKTWPVRKDKTRDEGLSYRVRRAVEVLGQSQIKRRVNI